MSIEPSLEVPATLSASENPTKTPDETSVFELQSLFPGTCIEGRLTLTRSRDRFQLRERVTSLSHTGPWVLFGSLAQSTRGQIGVDLEPWGRVSEEVSTRIRQTKESAGPYPNALWCAKESTWKALRGDRQPKTISQVQITDWRELKSFPFPEAWSFQYAEIEENGFGSGLGVVFRYQGWSLAVFCGLFGDLKKASVSPHK